MNKLMVSVSPHVTSNSSTRKIMLDVCIALVPALIAGIIFYGFYALFLVLLSIGASVLGEFLYNLIRKKPQTVGDCSAIVTGLLLGLNLPVTVPFYVPIVGGIFATMIVKMLFGGIGKNFANPAITARIFLLLAWTSFMTKFVAPIDINNWGNECLKFFNCALNGGGEWINGIASATPLSAYKAGATDLNLLNMFLGNIGGSIGETCIPALLFGGIYLLVKKVIDWKIPTIFIGTTVIFSLIFGGVSSVLPQLLGGGLFIGAFFMATDYSTSPNTKLGVCIFAFGCGFLTTLIRFFGGYPEGVSFAILLMNILTPLLDKWIVPKPFGYVRKKREKKNSKVVADTAKEGK